MRILQVHNRYRAGRGGEDAVLEAERALLMAHGHQVEQLFVDNADIAATGPAAMTLTAIRSVWSAPGSRTVSRAIADCHPDVVHFHNTYAVLSPAAFVAAHQTGIPVVATLHNYRMACATAFLYRDGAPCQQCVGRMPWPAITNGCRYGGSRVQGLGIAATKVFHRLAGTYVRNVDAWVVLSTFAREIMLRDGLPASRVHVRPNFVTAPLASLTEAIPGRFAFAGLLAPHKGPDLLVEAITGIRDAEWSCTIAGEGELGPRLRAEARQWPELQLLGWVSTADARRAAAAAQWLVVPSRQYEGFPMVVAEALALGRPVIAPAHGPFPEILDHGRAGLLFTPGDAEALRAALRQGLAMSRVEWEGYARAAADLGRERYNPEEAHASLMRVYRHASAGGRDYSGGAGER